MYGNYRWGTEKKLPICCLLFIKTIKTLTEKAKNPFARDVRGFMGNVVIKKAVTITVSHTRRATNNFDQGFKKRHLIGHIYKKVDRKAILSLSYLVFLLQSGEKHSLLHTQMSVNHPKRQHNRLQLGDHILKACTGETILLCIFYYNIRLQYDLPKLKD